MEKIGFFGGSFNPPTIAHLKIVETAINEFGLDKVVIVPMGDKYEKSELISFDLRFNMLKEVFKNNEKVEISNMQKNQQKRTYAIDSFKEINEVYKNSNNFFIMGSDNFSKISEWKGSNELLKNYKYLVFNRDDSDQPKNIENSKFFDISSSISSTDIRNKIKNNQSLENLLDKKIIDFINKNNLYKEI